VTQSWLFGCVHTLRRLGGSSSVIMFFGVLFGLDFNRAFHGVRRVVPATSCILGRSNRATVCDNLPIALPGASRGCAFVLFQSVFTGTDRTGVVGSFTSLFGMSVLIAFLALFRWVRVPHYRRSFVAAMNQYRGSDFVHFIRRDRYYHRGKLLRKPNLRVFLQKPS